MFVTTQDAKLKDFKQICETKTQVKDYPLASGVEKNVLIYDGDRLRETLRESFQGTSGTDSPERITVLKELHHALKEGPGVLMIQNFYNDPDLIDRVTETFKNIIARESQESGDRGDHFAQGSPNSRIWNVVEKLLDENPHYFYDYFKNPLISLVAQAWLGPAYQMTAQVNLVRPGSKSQVAHRDYHLGFLDDEVIIRYPLTVQDISQYLTLQGAVAHCDMPLESGPTLFLPHSQKYPLGYSAMRRPDFIEYFNEKKVQNELSKGDAVFFSPALFHAAGENRSQNLERMGNLLQISSSFGRAMEKVDLVGTATKIYPILLEKIQALSHPHITAEMETVIEIAASGYPFPSDLDVMKPKSGSLTPASDQDVMRSQLLLQSPAEIFEKALGEALRENQI